MSKKLLAAILALIMVLGCVSALAEETVKLTRTIENFGTEWIL